MKPRETAGDFHQRHGKDYADAGQFNVYRVEEFHNIHCLKTDGIFIKYVC